MRKKRGYFIGHSNRLINFLEKNGIKYTIKDYGKEFGKMVRFDIYDDESYSKEMIRFSIFKPEFSLEYSQKELDEAEFLSILPTKDNVDIDNDEDLFRYYGCKYDSKKKIHFWQNACAYKSQVKPLIIHGFSSWGRAMFYNSDDGSDIIFARKSFEEFVLENNITGIELWPVYVRKNKELKDSGLYQLRSTDIIPFEKIIVDDKKKLVSCCVCGQKKIIYEGTLQLKFDYKKGELNKDFYMTVPEFGQGISSSVYLISHRLYELLKENKMDRNMIFEPVKLIDE